MPPPPGKTQLHVLVAEQGKGPWDPVQVLVWPWHVISAGQDVRVRIAVEVEVTMTVVVTLGVDVIVIVVLGKRYGVLLVVVVVVVVGGLYECDPVLMRSDFDMETDVDVDEVVVVVVVVVGIEKDVGQGIYNVS